MPVHVYGNPCNTEKIKAIADKYGLKIIYDAAHAFGVEQNGKSILNAGDISTLSFHATKTYNTVEGGALVCHDEKTKKRIDYLKNFGFAGETEVVMPGINGKMDEIRAAYGLLNLKHVKNAIEKRKKLTDQYRALLRDIPGIRFMDDIPGVKYNYSYFPIFVDKETYGLSRDELYEKLKNQNILGRRYFYPLISTFSTYRGLASANPDNLPVAAKLAESVICLPMHHGIGEKDVDFIGSVIRINYKTEEGVSFMNVTIEENFSNEINTPPPIRRIYRKAKKLFAKLIPKSVFAYISSCLSTRQKLKPKKELNFEIHLTDHCNLNCKGCGHFSPLAEEKYLDIDIFERDCARISYLTNRCIHHIDLMGGEPLLHPQLTQILDIARKYFDGTINIVTNGILLLRQPKDLWQCCKDNAINIIISAYPININRTEIKIIAEEYGVDIEFRGGNMKEWFRFVYDVKGGTRNIKSNFKICAFANAFFYLEDGKLATCGTPLLIKHFNKYFNQKLKTSEHDYIDIYKANNIHEILTFLSKPIPFCRYCKPREMVNGVVEWGISKKEISEWT
ncbi:hypothetical protein FACS189445_3590 [Spirochaetia bacterium]|nr:hypothetical protein FACS189445_3590 [Spirochaetia bacterium]